MPITFTPSFPNDLAGWGIQLRVTSDFVGPLAAGSSFIVSWTEDSDFVRPIWTAHFPTIVPFITVTMGHGQTGSTSHEDDLSLKDGDTVHLSAALDGPTSTLDTGTGTAIWSNTAGLHADVKAMLAEQPVGGLTTAQAAQLTQAVNNTTTTQESISGTTTVSIGEMLGAKSVDAFTGVEVTGGPTSGFVAHNLNAFVWAVLIRISTIGPQDVGLTPDGDWFLRDLAVARIFHGDDLYMRVPIHTSSKIIDMRPDNLGRIITAVEIALWPEAVSLQVTFAAGVSGQVFLLTLP